MNVHTLLRNAAGAAPITVDAANQTLPLSGSAGMKSLLDSPEQQSAGVKGAKQTTSRPGVGRGDSAASAHLVPSRTNAPASGG